MNFEQTLPGLSLPTPSEERERLLQTVFLTIIRDHGGNVTAFLNEQEATSKALSRQEELDRQSRIQAQLLKRQAAGTF